MHDDADFLRAILANPFDDAPRLIYAEWLEDRAHESGGSTRCGTCQGKGRAVYVRFEMFDPFAPLLPTPQKRDTYVDQCNKCHGIGRIPDHRAARAEFIRLQCEYDRLFCLRADSDDPYETTCNNTECRRCHIEHIASRMIHDPLTGRGWRNEWSYPCLALLNDSLETFDEHVEFRRGFVSSISCTLAAFMDHAAEIFARHPVTEVRLTDLIIHQSGGNDTYYMGNLGAFPREYWRRLENLKSSLAVRDAVSNACVDYGRSIAGLPPLAWLAVENAAETSESQGFNVSSILCR